MDLKKIQPKKVLIANVFGIGDVLFTLPLITHLKSFNPEIEIGYLCNRRTEEVLDNYKDVDRVFVYERDEFQADYKKSKRKFLGKIKDILLSIKSENYDLCLDVSLSGYTSFFSWVIGIKHRIGFDYKGRGVFLSHRIPFIGFENEHVVDHYLRLIEKIGLKAQVSNLSLPVGSKEVEWVGGFLNELGVDQNAKIIGLVPGGGASWGKDAKYKQWGCENYAKLADKIVENLSATIILLGGEKDQEICSKVSSNMKNRSFTACGKTSIMQFVALAKKTSLMIVNDGGPLHLAVAAGSKTVSIFGPVDENVYGPYPKENHVVITHPIACRPCYRRFRRASCEHISCLSGISVDQVFSQVSKAFV